MKLDVTVFRYMTKEEFRVLTAVEMGMRNHEFVAVPLIESIAKLNRGGTHKIIGNLLRHKLLAHENKSYDGYRLTYKGYDFLALRALAARGSITDVGRRLGVGKESDVHFCRGPNGEWLAMKLHRLGRISFRSIKNNRDYMQHRAHGSWMYMARLAALKEFSYMKALHDEGFPVPTPIDQNRHVVVMSMIDAVPMYTLRDIPHASSVMERLMRLLVRLGRAGIVHGDFNEFNLLINENDQKVTLIDFPQIVHLHHKNAREYFERDVKCVMEYFRKKCDLDAVQWPTFDQLLKEVETDGGAVLKSLQVAGMKDSDDALLVAAHGSASEAPSAPRNLSNEDDSEDSDDGEVVGKEEAAGDAVGLVPDGGRTELQEGAEMDGALTTDDLPEGYTTNIPPEASAEGATAEDSESEESEGESDASEEAAPGQVIIASDAKKKKTRQRQTAKEARKNLQKQQKTKPAKANNMKVKELRQAKHQVKEFIM